MKKNLLHLFFIVLISLSLNKTIAQQNDLSDYKYIHMNPSIGFGIGTTYYFGDLSKEKDLRGARIASLGSHLAYAHPFSKSFVGKVNLNFNKIGQFGIDTSNTYHNFKTTIFGLDFGGRYRFDNDKILSSQQPLSLFIGVGVGYSIFNVREDQKNAANQIYHYWSDGTIRTTSEDALEAPTAQIIERDYTFETQIETQNNGFLYSYFEIGFGLKITTQLNALFSYKHNFAFSDELDGLSLNNKKDKFIYLSAGLSYYFGKPERTNIEILQEKAAEKLYLEDADDDGVPDIYDKCPQTHKGWEVDANGCPLDDDGDGVPNKLDKEPNTPKGNLVNSDGVSISDEEFEVLYLLQTGEMDMHPNFNEFKLKYPKLFSKYYGEEVIQKTKSFSEEE